MSSRYRLMIPGPTESPAYVLHEMAEPVLPHYESEWAQIYWEIVGDLQKVLGTRSNVFPINGSGTLSFEIAMASLLAPGDRVLCLPNSFYGKAMGTASEGFGARVTFLDLPMFKPVPVDVVEKELHKDRYTLVVTAHHDTASGFLNPLEEIGELCRRHDVPLLVDCVSSIGALPIEMDAWGIDFACASVQKALDCPAGIAVVGVSGKAWRKMDAVGPLNRGRYMNLRNWRTSAVEQRDLHPNLISIATNNMMGLRASLKRILEEGLENRHRRMSRYGRMIRAGIRNLGLETFVDERYAPLLTRVVFPKDLSASEARDHVRFRHGILVGAEFRIPHFGAGVNTESITILLLAIEDYLRSKGKDICRGTCLQGLEAFHV
jgi:aspartate aminotransferase-like enzyme